MIILGINCFGHDSAASFCIDGKVKFACEEERLSRVKHSGSIPFYSIATGLEELSISWQEIDFITFSWNPWTTYVSMPKYISKFANKVPKLLKERRSFSMEENLGMLNYLREIRNLPKILDSKFGPGNYKFYHLNHHSTHAASAFYPSGFDKACVLTMDGAGEWETATIQKGEGNKLKKILKVNTPNSLGAVYLATSKFLGFDILGGPGKLMGLASYGKRNNKFYDIFRKIITLDDQGFKVDMSYFAYHYSRKTPFTSKFIDVFGLPAKINEWSEDQLDLAAAVQQRIEDAVLHLVRIGKEKVDSENLVMAGGVALNSVANGLVAKSKLFKNIFIQPAANDSGTSSGGPLYLYHHILGNSDIHKWRHAFLGPKYSVIQIEKKLNLLGLTYQKLDERDVSEASARLIAEGKIIAWFQGALEFGPRALGNRSILASPLIKGMNDILNQRVKFREKFRPFAAAILEEDQEKYLDFSFENPYMLMVFNVKKEMHQIIPAITHVDGTVRIQTVKRQENEKLYSLLHALKQITGHGIVINTSFNIKGEPIVCTPDDAIRSFQESDIDALVIENLILKK